MFYKYLKQKFVKDSIFLYSSSYISYGLTFITAIVLAKGLGVETYGLLALLISIIEFTKLSFTINTNEATVKFLSEYIYEEKGKALLIIKTSYLLDFILGTIISAILFFTAGLIGEKIFHDTRIEYFLKIYALLPLCDSVQSTSNAVFQVFKKFNHFGSMMVFSKLMKLLGVIFFISTGLQNVLFALIGATAIVSILYLVLAIKLIYNKFSGIRIVKSFGFIRAFLCFNLHVYLSTTFKALNSRLDILLLGYFRPLADVGYYKIALTIVGILTVIYEPLVVNIYPRIAELWNQKRKMEIKNLLIKRSVFIGTFAVIVATFIVLFSRPFIRTFYGTEYDPACLAIYILIGGGVYASFVFWARSFALGIGRPDISALISFLSAVFVIAGNIILIPIYGYIGAAIVFTLNLCIFNTVWILIFNRVICYEKDNRL